MRYAVLLITQFLATATLSSIQAQQPDFERRVAAFPIFDGDGVAFEYPLLGGLNSPRPQFIDIDGDGDVDLFVLEELASSLMFFENTGTPQVASFEWRDDAFQSIPASIWFRFVDLDDNGLPDLLVEGAGAIIRLYRNDGAGRLVLAADTLFDTAGEIIRPELLSIPDLVDIDCDGDLDLFLGLQTGAVRFYENLGLDAQRLPRFRHITDSFQDILIVGVGKATDPNSRHGANAIRFADIDADGDSDMFWGDFFASSVYFLVNRGTCPAPQLSLISNRFPQPDTLLTGGFNVPEFVDIDGDGDLDFFAGVLSGVFSSTRDQIDNFYFYENTGSATVADFVRRSRRFIASLDIGEYSVPALADIDGDGDLDLFLANEADPANPSSGRIYFFENTGSAAAPQFRLRADNYFGIEIGYNPKPAFVDIDDDGDLDLFIGQWDGTIAFYRNAGTAAHADYRLETARFADIDVGNNSTPAFADIDDDGRLDLFIGEFAGNINFYRNQGSRTAPRFVLDTTHFAGIDIGIYSFPCFVDADGDGDLDLYAGTGDGDIRFFENRGDAITPDFVEADPFPHALPQRSAPVFADLDGDGDLDLLAGNFRGGLFYFENQATGTGTFDHRAILALPQTINLRQNNPNPFNPQTTIVYELQLPARSGDDSHSLSIYDLRGRLVRQWHFATTGGQQHNSVVWDGRDSSGRVLASGVYVYRLRAGAEAAVRKMLLLR